MRQALLLIMVLAATTTTATAQAPRKKACELLSIADVEAVTGVSPLRALDLGMTGQNCTYEKVASVSVFSVSLTYTDAPDADAVIKYLKIVDTQTIAKARPAAGIGDAAYYTENFGNRSLPKTLAVFVGGKMVLTLGPASSDEALRSLAEKVLGGSGRTQFAYNGVVPATPRPASAPTVNAASSSPLDALKTALTKKAEAGDTLAEEALAGLYRFPTGGARNAAKPDFAAAMYWYKRASDHGVARASYQLGTMYHEGIGVPVNDDAAQALFTKAADAGYVPAMLPLAFLYAAKPDFISKRRAAEWGLKAAAADDPEGHLVAGYMWDKGLLSFDEAESGRNALAEYGKAAARGNCSAMMNTGGLYFNGSHGMKQDATQAQAWFDRAQACFGKDFQEMQAKADKYRSLAAAGRLPVPQAPPPLPKGSRFFSTKPGVQRDDLLVSIVSDILEVTSLGVAYLVAHPEELARMPAQTQNGPTGISDLYHTMEMGAIVGKSFNCSMVAGGC
jgi:TPR repeat protein